MKKLYFAYGSNLNLDQMKKRCPDSVGVSPAVLVGWRLIECTYADIEEALGECVNGALYEISDQDLANLDRYEGYPEYYTRKEVMVTDKSGIYRQALVYTMTEKCGKHRGNEKYSDRYRKICSDGAEEWGIPNAFSSQEGSISTLWGNGVPDIAEGLERMLDHLDPGKAVPQAKRLWVGAGVVLSLKQQKIGGDFGFYPAPIEIVTPHALELSWIFYDLQKIFKTHLNSINKFDFYRALADAASCAIENDPGICAGELCRQVVLKAEEFYNEME